ncbi:MAG: DUF4397 domain-containing protein [Chitinophagaceae bacterium]|nr:DUF4397 domain-containing protein [Chitinophagaceae bacterium]
MKPITYLLLCLTFSASCKKDGVTTTPLASLNIINTIVGGSDAKLRSDNVANIYNNGSGYYSVLPGNPDLYVYPIEDSVNPYYHANKTVVMEAGQIYSLFLGGVTSQITSLLVHENDLAKQDDSIRVRILNFSPDAPPVNVRLSTLSDINEFSAIGFSEITDFKAYKKTGTNTEYTFEFRDANTDVLITSFTIYDYLFGFNHFTLVMQGMVAGDPAPGVTFVFHN